MSTKTYRVKVFTIIEHNAEQCKVLASLRLIALGSVNWWTASTVLCVWVPICSAHLRKRSPLQIFLVVSRHMFRDSAVLPFATV